MADVPMLSIVIPVYNEQQYLPQVLQRVRDAPLPDGMRRQIIVVDDGSTDGTAEVLRQLQAAQPDLCVLCKAVNEGKGAAIADGFAAATGEFVIIQDADFEYDPADYPVLLQPLLNGEADVVYGSRFADPSAHRGWHRRGNAWLTAICNRRTGLRLTDMECCYKVFRREVLKDLKIEEKRFGVEPEITCKLAAMDVRIAEVPVRYAGRGYSEGKKIGWKDAISAIRCIYKYSRGRGV